MTFPRQAGSYACVYYVLDGHHDEWFEWSTPQVHRLYEADRGFASRTHYNTGTYRHAWRAYRDADPVPLELALDHRYGGLVAQFVEPAQGEDQAAVDRWFDAELPAWIKGSPVATVSNWTTIPLLATKPDFVPDDPGAAGRSLQLMFLDADPLESWDHQRELAARLEASGVGRVVFAAPFIPTVIGTDRYVDELW
jgi:hypothetical protein